MVAYKPALTTTEIDKMEVKDHDYRVNLGLPGLYINVWKGGGRTFTLWYRCKSGRVRQPTLGKRPYHTADEMFNKALDWLKAVRDGLDPYQIELDKVAAQKQAMAETLKAVVPVFLENKLSKARSKEDVRRILNKHLLPVLGDRPVREIRRPDINALLDSVKKNSGPSMARRLYSWLHLLFRWCIGRDLTSINPCHGIEDVPRPNPRARTFTKSEFKLLWQASAADNLEAEGATDSKARSAYVRCLLLLGQRRTETATMEWTEVDLNERIWAIPPEKMKNKRWHEVTLPPFVVVMLQKLKPAPGCPYVFTDYARTGHFRDYVGLKQQLLSAMKKIDPEATAKMKQWQLHDARRSMRTGLSKCSVLSDHAEMCISHYPSGVEAIYDRADFRDEKFEAFRRWQRRLAKITGDPELRLGPKPVDAKALTA